MMTNSDPEILWRVFKLNRAEIMYKYTVGTVTEKKNVCWRVLLSAALTELDESKLVFSSSGDSGTENELMFSSYLGPPHPLVRGE